jgi:hypothetical protein
MSAEEHARSKVRKNLLGFVEMAESLIEIRDRGLWRESHASFREYVEAKFGDKADGALEVLDFYEMWASK